LRKSGSRTCQSDFKSPDTGLVLAQREEFDISQAMHLRGIPLVREPLNLLLVAADRRNLRNVQWKPIPLPHGRDIALGMLDITTIIMNPQKVRPLVSISLRSPGTIAANSPHKRGKPPLTSFIARTCRPDELLSPLIPQLRHDLAQPPRRGVLR
ncbi:hypothetical protein CI238_05032, partial [Colletotrichum incanum]